MTGLVWRPLALANRLDIMTRIGQDNPQAALELDLEFKSKAEMAQVRPTRYKPGRAKGTREIVVRPNYVMVYRVHGGNVEILRVLHAAQQWP